MQLSTRSIFAACAALVMAASSAGPALGAVGPAASRGAVRAQASAWSVVHSPNEGSGSNLDAVSCVSASACTAVGSFKDTGNKRLIETWDGATWSIVPPGNKGHGGFLYGVSCVSASACSAVGLSGGALVESWNGTRWSTVPSAKISDGILAGVSCVSASACTAVGEGSAGTLVESWNGTEWSVVPSPNKGMGGFLSGVSCVSASGCTAAGYYAKTVNGIEGQRTLVESNSAGS